MAQHYFHRPENLSSVPRNQAKSQMNQLPSIIPALKPNQVCVCVLRGSYGERQENCLMYTVQTIITRELLTR